MSWTKTPAGYEVETTKGTARVSRVGKRHVLTLGRERVDLGARATFDHAEAALARLGAHIRVKAAGPAEPPGSRPATTAEVRRADPQRLLKRNQQQALALAERAGSRSVYDMLERARLDLKARLAGLPRGADGKFTAERMRATLRQVETTMGRVGRDLSGVTRGTIERASEAGMRDTVQYLHAAEQRFRGITVPLALDRAALFDHKLEGVQSTLLRQFPSSVARYGAASIAKFETVLQQGVIQQKMMDAVVADLVARDSFFEGRRYWAERIVRTESIGAYGRSARQAMETTMAEDWDDLRMVWVGHFDDRTGEDTHWIDGQTRRPGEPFENWLDLPPVMQPPNRPNCRCAIVAWRPEWPEPATNKPMWGDVPRARRR